MALWRSAHIAWFDRHDPATEPVLGGNLAITEGSVANWLKSTLGERFFLGQVLIALKKFRCGRLC